MTSTRDPRVDAYIASLANWQQSICREVRELVQRRPRGRGDIERTNRPYFVLVVLAFGLSRAGEMGEDWVVAC